MSGESATRDSETPAPPWPDVLRLVAHQLRGPVSLLAGYLEMLASEEVRRDPNRVDTILRKTKENLSEMNRLVGELQEGGRAAAGLLQIRRKKLGVHSLVEDVVQSATPLCKRWNVTLESKGEPVGGFVMGDGFYLKLSLLNLIDNAAKYGGSRGRLRLVTRTQDEMVELRVVDGGTGLGSKASELFAPFIQGPKAREGVGLGLSLVKTIVEAHGGSMVWRSGSGSYVGFKVPWLIN